MFTGIVEAAGAIEKWDFTPEGGRMVVHAPQIAAESKLGASVAVNGCCLTVVEIAGDTLAFDLSGETIRRTSFGELKPGARVNLERPMRAGGEFGGHFMQGHVDGVARVERLVPEGGNWWLSVRVPPELLRYVVMKGSIALDGISLTVAGLGDGIVDIAVIPFTYEHTNVAALALGDAMNVECDVLAKYVERLLDGRKETVPEQLTAKKLIEQGF